ncbi:MAG: DUF4099 domain-containing protein [Mangrovibacterium sp.]
MANFKLEEIPVRDMQALGLHDGKKLLLDRKNTETLLQGGLTSFIHFQNLKIEGAENIALDAKLSLRRKPDGSSGLFVHPIYKEKITHPALSPEEDKVFSRGGPFARKEAAYGKITAFGDAPYQFDKRNTPSFYIELEKKNGEKTQIWGVDLERALKESGHHLGDEVQLYLLGRENVRVQVPVRDEQDNVIGSRWEPADRMKWEIDDFVEKHKREKTVIYEFDRDTNSFVSVEGNQVNVPEQINGVPLSPRQKKRYQEGEEVSMSDGTRIQASPASEATLRSNRNLFMASILLDGGLSYVLCRGVEALVKAGERQKQEENIYSKGYMDALRKVQRDLEQKQAQFPNDREIARDLDVLREEIRRTEGTPDRKVNTVKAKVNDPELENHAQDRKEATAEKTDTDRSADSPERKDPEEAPGLAREESQEEIRTGFKR